MGLTPFVAAHDTKLGKRKLCMLGGHLPELLIIMVVALIVFGPKRLPEIGSSLGRGIRDFKKHVSEEESHDEPRPMPSLGAHASGTPVAGVEPVPAAETGRRTPSATGTAGID